MDVTVNLFFLNDNFLPDKIQLNIYRYVQSVISLSPSPSLPRNLSKLNLRKKGEYVITNCTYDLPKLAGIHLQY